MAQVEHLETPEPETTWEDLLWSWFETIWPTESAELDQSTAIDDASIFDAYNEHWCPVPLNVFLTYTSVFHWSKDVFVVLVDPKFGLDVKLFIRYARMEDFCQAVLQNLEQLWCPAKEVIMIMDWLFDHGWNIKKAAPTGMGDTFYVYLAKFHQGKLRYHYRGY
ncbi:hypothetical protein H9P43_005075 [Blastocladiella emersonii ATCC 22665]|nr:hypothetical protein H9P43_005075 [Blastocladiella emersonii ATCC 22665]